MTSRPANVKGNFQSTSFKYIGFSLLGVYTDRVLDNEDDDNIVSLLVDVVAVPE